MAIIAPKIKPSRIIKPAPEMASSILLSQVLITPMMGLKMKYIKTLMTKIPTRG